MKLPKKTNRYCPKCKKSTEQKISLVSSGHKRGTLTRGSISRAKKRHAMPGLGNKGKWGSKKAVKSWKRKSKTTTRKVLLYTCNDCKKSTQSESRRVSKILFE
ncbi:MAG: 50S ribosomal protein L44e [Candidatus Nanoarchaeia archaeon]|nr:50S ribosomal protein L44e [Candidatus Nanoarchaeia archaeon]